MARACSKNPADLNRDPSVRRTYRRNAETRRLESEDVPMQSPQVHSRKGKRTADEEYECVEKESKRARKNGMKVSPSSSTS